MLQQDGADDYVIATGETHSVRDCVDIAFDQRRRSTGSSTSRIDPALMRPAEVDHLVGDSSRPSASWAGGRRRASRS